MQTHIWDKKILKKTQQKNINGKNIPQKKPSVSCSQYMMEVGWHFSTGDIQI